MNQVINFYRRSGKRTSRVLESLSHGPIFKGITPPITQTPGRAQYYYPETVHLIPDSVLYKVRMPLKIASMEDSKKYQDVVQEKTLEYLKQRFAYNLFDPERGFHLDMTIKQLRQLGNASESSFNQAASGSLQEIIDSERTLRDQIDSLVTQIEDTLEDVEDKIEAYERATHKMSQEAGISCFKITDFVPFFGGNSLDASVVDALGQDPNNKEAAAIGQRLYATAHARHLVAHIRLDLVNCWNEHHANETFDKFNYEYVSRSHDNSLKALNELPDSWKGTTTSFGETLATVAKEQVPEYLDLSAKYERSSSSKDHFFSTFTHDDVYDQTPEQFKQDLLAYLSANIIVKEHRVRYQAEQYDRYMTASRWLPVHEYMTLKEFTEKYAEHLRREIEVSYDYVSPKIPANYDDYLERKGRPINSTVYYYFFNANRIRRRLAQAILSTSK